MTNTPEGLSKKNSFLPKVLVASMVAFALQNPTSAQQTEQDSVSVTVGDVESEKIKKLEARMLELKRDEAEQIKLLKTAKLWKKDIKNELPPVPKTCGAQPSVIQFNKRSEYKDCLLSAIPKMEDRVNAMKELLPKSEEKVETTASVDTSHSVSVASDTLQLTAADFVQQDEVEQVPTKPIKKVQATPGSQAISILGVIDLNDTTSINNAQVSEARKLLAKYGNVAIYGANMEGSLDANSTVEVLQVENVKSREIDGATTQYIVRVVDNTTGTQKQVIVTSENPIDKLTAAIKNDSGCYCFSLIQGDNDGEAVDPSLME